MDTERAIWQISGGPASRSYAGIFLRHGVGLIGPGDPGPWHTERADEDFDGASFVRRFASELQPGDVVLLRTGLSRIRAVGLVAGQYEYLSQFDDVNGWDLQHARRIRWGELPVEHDSGSSVFGANPPRLARVSAPTVVDYARSFVASPPTHWQDASLPPLPVEEPLLRALGWPPERIAVKWRYIDVALFTALPRVPATCQPRDVLVTDGVRYRLYAAAQGFAPVAYANLVRLKESALKLFEHIKRP